MYPRTLDCRRYSREGARIKWKRPLEYERMHGLLGREKCERDPRHIAFLTPKARPEGGVNDGFDCFGIRQRRQVFLTQADRLRPMTRKTRAASGRRFGQRRRPRVSS